MSVEVAIPDRGAREGDTHHARTAAQVSATLSRIWAELLHTDSIQPDDDFFEIGGDSLSAIRMLEHIGREFGDELLEPDVIYTASRFRDLANVIVTALARHQA